MRIKAGKNYNLTKMGLFCSIEKKNPLSVNSFIGTIRRGKEVLLRKCRWSASGGYTTSKNFANHPFDIISECKKTNEERKPREIEVKK